MLAMVSGTALARAAVIQRARTTAAPARWANVRRNALAEPDRHARWAVVREAAWRLLEPLASDGARIAIVGAGNGDDLPLARLARRADRLALIDVDPDACRAARRRRPLAVRRRMEVIDHDVTCGTADAIVAGRAGAVARPDATPLPGAPYDLVIGDLLYSQLLYPGLVDAAASSAQQERTLSRRLTLAVVARLHASAPCGVAVHLHDPVAWWPGHRQSFTVADVVTASGTSMEGALALARTGHGPHASDPFSAASALGSALVRMDCWRWPFARDVDYLVFGGAYRSRS